jgi:hypothetical protein
MEAVPAYRGQSLVHSILAASSSAIIFGVEEAEGK